jgi:chromosome segregation ATPase
MYHVSDDGRFSAKESNLDLVEHLGPLPDSSQRAPVSRPAETESTTAVAGGVSDDPGRIIYNLEQRLEAAKERNSKAMNQLAERDKTINEKTAEIDRLRTELQQTQVWRTAATDAHSQSEVQRTEMQAENERLQAEWQTEFTAAQKLRSEVQQLEGLNCKLSEILRDLQEHHTATDHRAEGARLAFLDVIKTLLEVRR